MNNPLLAVILLSLPTIVGTGFFLAGVVASKLHKFAASAVDVFREPTYVERLAHIAFFALYAAVYSGATLGPLLLPLAVYKAFSLTHAEGIRSGVVIWAWTFVILGLIAMALFWRWLTTLDFV